MDESAAGEVVVGGLLLTLLLRLSPARLLPARRRPWLAPPAVVAALALLAVACGGGEPDVWSEQAIAESREAALAQPILVNSSVGMGRNRLAFGLFDRDGGLVTEANVSLRLYALVEDAGGSVSATLSGEHELRPVALAQEASIHVHPDGARHDHAGPTATLFVASAEFAGAGWWGAELAVETGGERADGLRMRLWVSERTGEPMLGEQAPRSTQHVLRDVQDIAEIDTTDPPIPELHRLTVAEALDGGRPLVVAFATPLFCQTRFCGPVIQQVVRPLLERYGDRAEFVHIEPFDIAEARSGRLVSVPQMAEWGLRTEPWVFVIDGSGRVVAKFEGITSLEEVSAALSPLLGGR